MNKRKVFFRADASDKIGYGHFVRSLAVADMVKDAFDCTFYTEQPTDDQRRQVLAVCSLVELPAGDAKFQAFLDALQGDEIVFLDNYFFTEDYQRAIKQRGCHLICLGTNDRHYYADILLNFAESDPAIFDAEPYTRFKLGIEWTILREPFRKVSQECRPAFKTLRHLVICFGGTDQYGLTEKTIQTIHDVAADCAVTVVATDRFGLARMETLRQQGIQVMMNASAEELVALFNSADALICSASTIAHEGLACGLPVLCGYYVENQKRMYAYMEQQQLILGLSDMMDSQFPARLENKLTMLSANNISLKGFGYGDVRQRYLELFNSL